MHNRYHTQHPQFHLSLWLPPEDSYKYDFDVVGNDIVPLSEQSLSLSSQQIVM
jgi:N12 class adenine-specific DNA methylase